MAIGEQVLHRACAQNKAWQLAGLKPVKIAVNLSACQMRHDLPGLVKSVLEETGLDACYLELELTENILLENVEESIVILRELNKMGVESSIDDFGTGYSSLSYLQRLPISALKIDRSFLNNIQNSDDDTSIITTIITMAKNMNLNVIVIAEGAETQLQMDILCALHCNQAQGYLISRPLPGEEIESILMTKGNDEPGAYKYLVAVENSINLSVK
jgi:EAL domain-containing protein (putative c-di-GMP-specific phosphodiesterase class I)